MKKLIALLFVLVATITVNSQIHFIAQLDTKLDSCVIEIDYFDIEADSAVHVDLFGKGRFNKFKIYNIDSELTVRVGGINEDGEHLYKTVFFNVQGDGLNKFFVTLKMDNGDAEILCIDGNIAVLPRENSSCHQVSLAPWHPRKILTWYVWLTSLVWFEKDSW